MADIIDVNIGDSTLEVFWQDEVELNLDLNLMYIKSGQKEIQDYVDNVSKPEISNYVETEAKPLVTQIINEIAEPTVAEYIENTVKPEIDEYVEDKKPELQAYVTQASGYADNSQASATASAASAAASLTSANNAKTSETNAKQSETNALSYKNAAKSSQDAAKVSETNAKESEDNAKQSELNAKVSETNALNYKNSAQSSATTATDKANVTITKAQEALNSANNAKVSETNAKSSETKAKTSETNAASSATSAENSKNLAKQYADSVDSANIVHKTGDEAIDGVKTFTNLRAKVPYAIEDTVTKDMRSYAPMIIDKNNKSIGAIAIGKTIQGELYIKLGFENANKNKYDNIGIFLNTTTGEVNTYAPTPALSSNGSNIVNTFWANTKLNTKANTDLSNVASNIDYVVESNISNPQSWYRKFKSGWIEQGGYLPQGIPNYNKRTVTFPKPFTNKNYVALTCQKTPDNWDDPYYAYVSVYNNKETTYMVVKGGDRNASIEIYWYACGK